MSEYTNEYTKMAGELNVVDIGPKVSISWIEKTQSGKERVKSLSQISYVQHNVAISSGNVLKSKIYGKTDRQTYSTWHDVEANTQVVIHIGG